MLRQWRLSRQRRTPLKFLNLPAESPRNGVYTALKSMKMLDCNLCSTICHLHALRCAPVNHQDRLAGMRVRKKYGSLRSSFSKSRHSKCPFSAALAPKLRHQHYWWCEDRQPHVTIRRSRRTSLITIRSLQPAESMSCPNRCNNTRFVIKCTSNNKIEELLFIPSSLF